MVGFVRSFWELRRGIYKKIFSSKHEFFLVRILVNREGSKLKEELFDGCLLHFTDKVGLERAWRVVPFEALSVAIPKLETVLLLAILVAEVIWFASIPVGECDGPAIGHPEEVAFVSQIGARCPEVLVAKTWKRHATED